MKFTSNINFVNFSEKLGLGVYQKKESKCREVLPPFWQHGKGQTTSWWDRFACLCSLGMMAARANREETWKTEISICWGTERDGIKSTCLENRLYFFKKILMFTYFWERDRERASRGGAERGTHTESQAGSRLWAVSLMWGSNSWTLRSWPELKLKA